MQKVDKEEARQGQNRKMVSQTLVISSALAVLALLVVLAFYVF